MHSNPKECQVRGRLSDADAVKLQNLAFTGSTWTWENRHLKCQLPEDHDVEVHVQRLAAQGFKEPVTWWASWLDIDGLRDQAALFTGPLCSEPDLGSDTPPGEEAACLLLDGHTTEDDERHMFL